MSHAAIIAHMLAHDTYSQWLGIEVLDAGLGECRLHMTLRDEMCNGHGTVHGGVLHALADSAFAFACNSRGRRAVAAETSVSYLAPASPGDVLEAHATEDQRGRKLGRYTVHVRRPADGTLVIRFFATCYVLEEEW